MKRLMGIILGVVLFCSANVNADIVELDLFTLGCPTVFDEDHVWGWTSDIDLGTTFSQIDRAYIDWAGGITAGLAINYSDPCNPFPLDVSINAYFPSPVRAGVGHWGGRDTYPYPEPFDIQSNFSIWGSWNDLLDGTATLSLYYDELISINGKYIEPGSVALTRATLVVEGTIIVPEPVEAEINIDPDTFNLASKGKWLTCYIWLPEDYNVADIEPNSIVLKNEPNGIYADWIWFEEEDQLAMAKFNRSDVQSILEPGDVELTVSGELTDGTRFEGTDTIRVIDKGGKKR